MKKNKILILHDTFLYKGGGERLIMMMGKALKADIASWFFSSGSFDLRKEGFEGKIIPVSSEIFAKWFRHIKLKFAFLFQTKFIADYQTVIFSWDCISAVRNCAPATKKIYYCHTPPRYLYDLKQRYLQKIPFYMKPVFHIISSLFRYMYENDVKKIDLIITNSENTRQRLKHFTGLDSQVLYPAVNLASFQWATQWDYYISVSRLSSAKRVDHIVKAFLQMPDKKLIVIYWINDPQKQEIFDLAEWAKNIEFVTCPGNVWFNDYVANSIAGICVPVDEDFGMVPVESMAAGKPVLWVAEWGLKETVIDKKTGVLIAPGARVEDIIEGLNYLTPQRCLEMRDDCEARAEDFGLESFEKQLKNLIS